MAKSCRRVIEERNKQIQQEQEAFNQQCLVVRKTLSDLGRHDLVQDLDISRISVEKNIPISVLQDKSYYGSERYKRDQEYFASAAESESYTFRDFWFCLSHTYHDPAFPPLGFWRLSGIFMWTAFLIWGVYWLCS